LKVNVVGVHKGAQSSKRLARKEVGFAALHRGPALVTAVDSDIIGADAADIFEVLQEVGHCLPFAIR
jgi:hypothetical protein